MDLVTPIAMRLLTFLVVGNCCRIGGFYLVKDGIALFIFIRVYYCYLRIVLIIIKPIVSYIYIRLSFLFFTISLFFLV